MPIVRRRYRQRWHRLSDRDQPRKRGRERLQIPRKLLAGISCQYWIAEQQGSPDGPVILRGVQSVNYSVELMRTVISDYYLTPANKLLRRVCAGTGRTNMAEYNLQLGGEADFQAIVAAAEETNPQP